MRKFDLHGSHLPRIGSVGSAYNGRAREGEGKSEVQRGGGCAMPLRGQAPVTPNSLSFRLNPTSSRYKIKIFVEMQLKFGTL